MAGLQLGTALPNVSADSQVGSIHLHDLIGDAWLMLFSVSSDFDPVATTVRAAGLGSAAAAVRMVPSTYSWAWLYTLLAAGAGHGSEASSRV